MNAKSKYHILMQGTLSNNVSATCKEHGISRTIYYKWSKAYQQYGMNGLEEKTRKPVMPNQVNKRTERHILKYVAQFPEDGPKRIYYALQDEGIQVGESGIYNVLRRNELSTREDREAYAKASIARKGTSAHSVHTKGRTAKLKPLDYQLKHPENAYPGYVCLQSIQYMGVFPRIGKVYLYVLYDVYSRVALVKLYPSKASIHIIDFMKLKVIPLTKTLGTPIINLVTNSSREFATNWDRGKHKYSDFLHQNHIQQITTAADDSEMVQPLQQFIAILTKECYQQVWTDDTIHTFGILEKRLHEYMRTYNFNRVITDGPHQGKVPSDVALEYAGQQETLPLWLFTRR